MYQPEEIETIADVLESVQPDGDEEEMDLISKVNKKCKYLIDESKKLHQEKKVLKIMRSEIEKELKV